jgi:hypothetical protein
MPPTLGQRREEESSRQSILDSCWKMVGGHFSEEEYSGDFRTSRLLSRDGFVCGGALTLRFEVGYLPLWLLLKMEAPSVQAKERLGYIVNRIKIIWV